MLASFLFITIICINHSYVHARDATTLQHGYPCNIPRIDTEDGIDWLHLDQPFIFLRSAVSKLTCKNSLSCKISDSMDTDLWTKADAKTMAMQSLASRSTLLTNHGDEKVLLSSSNTYSHGEYIMTLRQYITDHVDTSSEFAPNDKESTTTTTTTTTQNHANETLYLFGGNYGPFWQSLADSYILPQPCIYCDKAGMKTIGIGGRNSGVSWHTHGPGFSEAILGLKRWFLFDPTVPPTAYGHHPNLTVSEWVRTQYPLLNNSNKHQHDKINVNIDMNARSNANDGNVLHLYECTLAFGEILYFPAGWMHATLNLEDYNVFVSTFLDTQLAK